MTIILNLKVTHDKDPGQLGGIYRLPDEKKATILRILGALDGYKIGEIPK